MNGDEERKNGEILCTPEMKFSGPPIEDGSQQQPFLQYAMMQNEDNITKKTHHSHVVIVGAGMAGLTCARELLQLWLLQLQLQQTKTQPPNTNAQPQLQQLCLSILEADDRIGGRLRDGNNNINEKEKEDEWIVTAG